MRDALRSSFPNLTPIQVTALALTGIDDVLAKEYSANGTLSSYNLSMDMLARTKYGLSIPQPDSVADGFIFGTKGTKC